MIDPDGDEWLTYREAARSVRVREDRVRGWVSRGRRGLGEEVRTMRVGRVVYVHMGDVRHAEARLTSWKRARQHAS